MNYTIVNECKTFSEISTRHIKNILIEWNYGILQLARIFKTLKYNIFLYTQIWFVFNKIVICNFLDHIRVKNKVEVEWLGGVKWEICHAHKLYPPFKSPPILTTQLWIVRKITSSTRSQFRFIVTWKLNLKPKQTIARAVYKNAPNLLLRFSTEF